MVVDRIETDFLEINRGVPQGTVTGPFLFSLTVWLMTSVLKILRGIF